LAAAGGLLLTPLPRRRLQRSRLPTVPANVSEYGQDYAVEDLYELLKHLGIEQAHVGG
jgi:hypothetical protein